MIKLRPKIFWPVFIVTLVLIAFKVKFYKDKIDEFSYREQALSDTLEVWRGKDSLNRSEKLVMKSSIRQLSKKNKELAEKIADKNFKIKNLKTLVTSNTTTEGSVKVPVKDTVIVQPNPDTVVKIVGRTFDYSDKWLSLKGLVQPDSVSIDYRYQSSVSIAYFAKRREPWKLWKPKVLHVQAVYQNPRTTPTALDAIQIKQKPKWYERKGFWFVAGMLSGVGITAIVK